MTNGSGDFSKAFSKLEAKFQDVEIKKSEKDYGFETPYYDSKNRNYPIRMVFEMSDSPSVWSYGVDMKGNNQWDTVMNTCVGINKSSSSVTPRSDNRCGPDFGNASCHSGYCCSKYSYCGKSSDHCGKGCQGKFGKCN